MKNFAFLASFCLLLSGCGKELEFEMKTFAKKSTLPCAANCPRVDIKIPHYTKGKAADSINAKLFSVMKEIVYFGEEPYDATDYQSLAGAFIASYEKLQKEEPQERFGWEAQVSAREIYRSERIVNIELDHYTFTGGAHGYSGKRSLIFDMETGKHLSNHDLFKDVNAFRAFAEVKFRQKFKIPSSAPINSAGFMFEEEKFNLPETVFFTGKGLLLYYNTYEIASYAEGPRELLLPYAEINGFLAIE